MKIFVRSLTGLVMTTMAIGATPSAGAAFADSNSLAPSQLISTSNLTAKESKYYTTIKDPVVAKNFIITRSYVRLCQAVVDGESPAESLPDKPLGFSVRYLLVGEATMINKAIAASIIAECKKGHCF